MTISEVEKKTLIAAVIVKETGAARGEAVVAAIEIYYEIIAPLEKELTELREYRKAAEYDIDYGLEGRY